MTIIHVPSPFLADRDTVGHALYEELIKLGLPDLAVECAYTVRAARDVAVGWEGVRNLTRDADIYFEFVAEVRR